MAVNPASDEVMWWSGLRWVDAARMQIWRFEEAFFEEARAMHEANERHLLSTGSQIDPSWRQSYDAREPFDPERPLRVPSWSLHMQVANELNFLMIAVRNVLRAQERIPDEGRPVMGGQDVLALLRNVAEHWDEVGGRSARALASDHPEIQANGIAYTGKEVWIGGTEGVPVSRIIAWLDRVWDALKTCLADSPIEVPDDLNGSRVVGDDSLVWPAERLHFHWSLPRVDEHDWPHRMPPDDVVEAMAAVFARRRARDHTD